MKWVKSKRRREKGLRIFKVLIVLKDFIVLRVLHNLVTLRPCSKSRNFLYNFPLTILINAYPRLSIFSDLS